MERSFLAEPRNVHWATDLHSEYRSTYRWHEYKGTQAPGVVKQPAPAPQPPSSLPLSRGPGEPAMPRRKKYPGLAYKTNEIFDTAPVGDQSSQRISATTLDRARSVERNDAGRPGAGRRSKSEGPRQPRWTDTVEAKATTAALGEVLAVREPEASTEYRNQFAWPRDTVDAAQPRKSTSMGALKLAGQNAKKKAAGGDGSTETEPLMNHNDDHVADDHPPKKYIEDYLWNGQKPGVHRKTTFRSALSALISNGEDRSKDNRKRYKSEYKKKFRPFSQYVFEASKGTFTKCRGLKGKTGSVEREEGATERMLPAGEEAGAGARDSGPRSLGPAQSDSWYREVLDLRKRAGEYKYRGWGTEMAPDHITQLYNKQIELWYQVSRRSSLSALALASTNHKALPRDEKEAKETKSQSSPKKVKSFRSAPHQSIHAKLQETRALERSPQKTSPQKVQRKKLQGQSFDETAGEAAPVVAGGRPSEVKAEFRSPRRRPRSADPKPTQHLVNGHEPPQRPHKPTGLLLNTSRVRSTVQSAKRNLAKSPTAQPVGAQRRSRSVSKVGIKLEEELPSHRSASVAKDHFFDDSPVVKSPPEPTRVKSPEQMNMRSPDPVNWTVPLDTGKTFTVTQNVKSELVLVHHQLSPIRTLKKSDSPTGHKRLDKTPTTPTSLTPIDETKALDITRIVNGNHSSNQLTPEEPKIEPAKKTTEATQVAPGVVDTTVVNDSAGLTASEVLDRARNRFDKFWGKKEENV